ncbi:hypothetical protein [Thalassospira lucentensis]|uniref:hypothetical protein n=1 Tax=Thalassospira lucentensis TaxID=168935 RepID=UPI00142D49CB|nr:hypothetical protein [Thalassospira lucentensis]NIZ02588.1 hypothetical protein [Thalassospira lucentensis]
MCKLLNTHWRPPAIRGLILLAIGVFFAGFPAQNHSAKAASSCELIVDPTNSLFLTSDMYALLPTQATVNCYAWQMFIALNWPVDSGWPQTPSKAGEPDRTAKFSDWGVPSAPQKPLDMSTVWASFMSPSNIFKPYAAKPDDWGVPMPKPTGCKASSDTGMLLASTPLHVLQSTSKDNDHDGHMKGTSVATSDDTPSLSIMEATGGWLTDQNKNLIFFEQKVGKAEFDYIVENGLFDAKTQLMVAKNEVPGKSYPFGLNLPSGKQLITPPAAPQAQEELGSFELKAAWRILTDHPEQFSRYLTSTAWVKDPETGDCASEVIGLVGLHIIHKTLTFPDFIWTTFEQIDNVPTSNGNPHHPYGYSFYNKDCKGPGDTCKPNAPRIVCSTQSGNEVCEHKFDMDVPVQVVREQPIASPIATLNQDVQDQISQATNGKSVFQYYQLVNVLWDQSPNPPQYAPGPNAPTPLYFGSFTSEGNLDVANTTMETYVQDQSCDSCHKYGNIAGHTELASDFSFLFKEASTADIGFLQDTIKNSTK